MLIVYTCILICMYVDYSRTIKIGDSRYTVQSNGSQIDMPGLMEIEYNGSIKIHDHSISINI